MAHRFRLYEKAILKAVSFFDGVALRVQIAEQKRRLKDAVPDGTEVVLDCDRPPHDAMKGVRCVVKRYDADADEYTLIPVEHVVESGGHVEACKYVYAERSCFDPCDGKIRR